MKALLNLNIHTSYFTHVWIIRTNSSQRVRNSHEFATDFERVCHTQVAWMRILHIARNTHKKLPFCCIRIFHMYFIILFNNFVNRKF